MYHFFLNRKWCILGGHLSVGLVSCQWWAKAWPLLKVNTPVTLGIRCHCCVWPSSHFSAPLFVGLFGVILRVADLALGTLTDSSPAFSTRICSTAHLTNPCLYEQGMQQEFMATIKHNKLKKAWGRCWVKIIEASLEFHLFANALQMHTHGRAPFCLPERSILRENRGSQSI